MVGRELSGCPAGVRKFERDSCSARILWKNQSWLYHFLGTRRFISDGFFAGICFPTDKGSLVLPEKKGRLKAPKDKILSFGKGVFLLEIG